MRQKMDKPVGCSRRPNLLRRILALLWRRPVRRFSGDWQEPLPPNSGCREPRNPIRPHNSGAIAKEPEP